MARDSLFAHLAWRFVARQEDLATEGLNYILASSIAARVALVRFLQQVAPALPSELTFRTQVIGVDGDRPDLVGTTNTGGEMLIVESKFWAGLTDNQPVAYLNRLDDNSGGLLLFICPKKRLDLLWNELLRRINEGGFEANHGIAGKMELRAAQLAGGRVLACWSWASLFSLLERAIQDAGDEGVAADLRQLESLCRRQDRDAFLPLQSEELSPAIPRRLVQYRSVITDVVRRMEQLEMATTAGYKGAQGLLWFGRYMTFAGYENTRLVFTVWPWMRHAETPLWLQLPAPAGLHLASLQDQEPPGVFLGQETTHVPLFIPVGIEQAGVVDSIFAQVVQIHGLLRAGEHRQQTDTENL